MNLKISYMKNTLSLFIVVFSMCIISCGSDEQKSESKVDVTDKPIVNELSAVDLRSAALNGDLQTVSETIGQGVPVDESDELGRTALMFAAAEGNRDVVEILLNHGADASLEDDDGETAIDFAANNGHAQTVTLLRNSLTQ
jgi:ankyrin repeat protein